MEALPDGLLDEIVARIVDGLRPERIYLFGSHACGTPHRHSDIDLLIVVSDTDRTSFSLYAQAERALRGMLAPVEMVICQRREWDHAQSALASLPSRVAASGKLLYDSRSRTSPTVAGQGH